MRYNHTPTTQVQLWAADRRARTVAIYRAVRDRLQARLHLALQRGISLYRHIPLITNSSPAAPTGSAATAQVLLAGDWKARSVAAYRQAQSDVMARLPAELASRVHSLTGIVKLILHQGLRLANTKYYGTSRDCLERIWSIRQPYARPLSCSRSRTVPGALHGTVLHSSDDGGYKSDHE